MSKLITDLKAVNARANGNYECLPSLVGIVNSITSDCGSYRLFRYPAVGGRMKLYAQSEKGQFVFVECSHKSISLLGVGEFRNNFDLWAEKHCTVLCDVELGR